MKSIDIIYANKTSIIYMPSFFLLVFLELANKNENPMQDNENMLKPSLLLSFSINFPT